MKKDKYVEMNIDEMKSIKAIFRIRLKSYANKLKQAPNVALKESYSECVRLIKHIIDIYKDLIDLGENCELEENYFKTKIKEIQRLHNALQQEEKRIERLIINNHFGL